MVLKNPSRKKILPIIPPVLYQFLYVETRSSLRLFFGKSETDGCFDSEFVWKPERLSNKIKYPPPNTG